MQSADSRDSTGRLDKDNVPHTKSVCTRPVFFSMDFFEIGPWTMKKSMESMDIMESHRSIALIRHGMNGFSGSLCRDSAVASHSQLAKQTKWRSNSRKQTHLCQDSVLILGFLLLLSVFFFYAPSSSLSPLYSCFSLFLSPFLLSASPSACSSTILIMLFSSTFIGGVEYY